MINSALRRSAPLPRSAFACAHRSSFGAFTAPSRNLVHVLLQFVEHLCHGVHRDGRLEHGLVPTSTVTMCAPRSSCRRSWLMLCLPCARGSWPWDCVAWLRKPMYILARYQSTTPWTTVSTASITKLNAWRIASMNLPLQASAKRRAVQLRHYSMWYYGEA